MSCGCNKIVLKGCKGDEGPVGPRGPIGYPGVMGLRGIKGDEGVTGEKGQPGLTGAKGEKGRPGIDGNSGIKGEPGLPGVGITSIVSNGNDLELTYGSNNYTITVSNVKGEKGIKGCKGEPGNVAFKGDQGPIGPIGDKGDPGNFSFIIPNNDYVPIERTPSLLATNIFYKYDFYNAIQTQWQSMTNTNLIFQTHMAINKDYIKNFYCDLDINKKEKLIKIFLVSFQENYKKFLNTSTYLYCNSYLDNILVQDPNTNIYKLKDLTNHYLGGRLSDLSFNIDDYIIDYQNIDFSEYFDTNDIIEMIFNSIVVPFNNYYINNVDPTFVSGPVNSYVRENNNFIALSVNFLVNIRHIDLNISDDRLKFYQHFAGKFRKLEKGMLILEFVNPNTAVTIGNVASELGITSLINDDTRAPMYVLIINSYSPQTGYFTTLDTYLQNTVLIENNPILNLLCKSFSIKGYFDFPNEQIRMSMFFHGIEDIGIPPIYCGNLLEDQENGIQYSNDYITNLPVPITNYYGTNNVLFEFLENINTPVIDSNYLKAISGIYKLSTITTNIYYLTGMISNN